MAAALLALVVAVVGGVVVLAIWDGGKQGLSRWLGRRTASRHAAGVAESHDASDRLTVLREQVADVARGRGMDDVPLRWRGANPVVVTFANGETASYFCNFDAYKAAMRTGRTDLRRSYPGNPPGPPVSRWDKAKLEQWLSENAT